MTIRAKSSIFSRLVLIAIVTAGLLVAGLWFVTDRTIRATLEENAAATVDVDLAGLADIYASGGIEELQARIADRLALVPLDGTQPHYLLQGEGGRRIAGDITVWPKLDPAISESGRIELGENSPALARATQLDAGLYLLVAHTIDDNSGLLDRVAMVFLAGGGIFVLLVAIASRLAATRLQRRIARINTAFQTSNLASLSDAVSATSPDEIDELTAHSSAALLRVQRLMESYRDSSDHIAHEIRTPLMHVDAKLAKSLGAEPALDVRQHIAGARQGIRELVAMLEGLLDIAASNARRGDLARLKPVDLSSLCQRICDLYADSAEESGHEFSWVIHGGVFINAEEDQMARLITNLLDNALKYVPAGGSISLSLEEGPILTVEDNGPGIAPQDRDHVFERFFRGAAGAKEESGAGLGLALARAIAHRHGLSIKLDQEHSGAKFVIERMEER